MTGVENPTGTEAEYKHLISYFERLTKLTMGALVVLVGVGAFLFWRSLDDVRTSAEKAIDTTKQSASAEILRARDESAVSVRNELRMRIDAEFEKSNIAALLDSAAKRRTAAAIDVQIDEELGRRISVVETELTETLHLSNQAMRMRMGFREPLEELQKIALTSKYENVRKLAAETSRMIANDYELRWRENFDKHRQGIPALDEFRSYELGRENIKGASDVLNLIRTSDDLNDVAIGFIALRQLTGQNFKMFDIPAAEKWCSENSAKCK